MTIDSLIAPLGEEGHWREDDHLLHPDAIEEVSEPVSPATLPSPQHESPGTSVLTEMLRHSPPSASNVKPTEPGQLNCKPTQKRLHVVAGMQTSSGARPVVDERTALLAPLGERKPQRPAIHEVRDLERQQSLDKTLHPGIGLPSSWWNKGSLASARVIVHPRSWSLQAVWRHGLVEFASYVPAVILGLLLNILDALSYGWRI